MNGGDVLAAVIMVLMAVWISVWAVRAKEKK